MFYLNVPVNPKCLVDFVTGIKMGSRKNESGKYLYSDNDSTWNVGYKIGKYAIKSSSASMNPADAHTWVYTPGNNNDKPANITVTCSTNNKN